MSPIDVVSRREFLESYFDEVANVEYTELHDRGCLESVEELLKSQLDVDIDAIMYMISPGQNNRPYIFVMESSDEVPERHVIAFKVPFNGKKKNGEIDALVLSSGVPCGDLIFSLEDACRGLKTGNFSALKFVVGDPRIEVQFIEYKTFNRKKELKKAYKQLTKIKELFDAEHLYFMSGEEGGDPEKHRAETMHSYDELASLLGKKKVQRTSNENYQNLLSPMSFMESLMGAFSKEFDRKPVYDFFAGPNPSAVSQMWVSGDKTIKRSYALNVKGPSMASRSGLGSNVIFDGLVYDYEFAHPKDLFHACKNLLGGRPAFLEELAQSTRLDAYVFKETLDTNTLHEAYHTMKMWNTKYGLPFDNAHLAYSEDGEDFQTLSYFDLEDTLQELAHKFNPQGRQVEDAPLLHGSDSLGL
ncbi:MAG: hypothetical protein GOV00_03540 [Candidatus Altiarchaeota archaeon]|nr:hypothetical protein [Candidatus Altiarchaeota archaeon]